jgi:ABC-type transport system involved in multi-copper enzyme maturation permease subunit
MTNGVPTVATVLLTLVTVTWRRFVRGKALWVAVVIGAFPVLMGAVTRDWEAAAAVEMFVMCLLPPVFVASAVAEEIEERTSTYLWSRPLPRWTLLVGKLLALAPIAALLIVLSWLAAVQVASDGSPTSRTILAFATGGLAISAMSSGIGTLFPKRGMALSISYFILIDLPVGAIPASVQSISVTRQVRRIAELHGPHSIGGPLLTMAVLSLIWLAFGLWRLRRLES